MINNLPMLVSSTGICNHLLIRFVVDSSIRLKLMGSAKYKNGFNVSLHENCLQDPYKWRKPLVIFVNSISDLYHEDVPLDFIRQIFTVMNENPQHVFQLLTKRPERLTEIAGELEWTANIWQGVTVESEKYKERIEHLRQIPAQIRFISFEPLLGDIGDINLTDIHWAIIGGESGVGCRPIEPEWILGIKEQCDVQNVTFYFKQWGGTNKKKTEEYCWGKHGMPSPKLRELVPEQETGMLLRQI